MSTRTFSENTAKIGYRVARPPLLISIPPKLWLGMVLGLDLTAGWFGPTCKVGIDRQRQAERILPARRPACKRRRTMPTMITMKFACERERVFVHNKGMRCTICRSCTYLSFCAVWRQVCLGALSIVSLKWRKAALGSKRRNTQLAVQICKHLGGGELWYWCGIGVVLVWYCPFRTSEGQTVERKRRFRTRSHATTRMLRGREGRWCPKFNAEKPTPRTKHGNYRPPHASCRRLLAQHRSDLGQYNWFLRRITAETHFMHAPPQHTA